MHLILQIDITITSDKVYNFYFYCINALKFAKKQWVFIIVIFD